MSWLFFCSFLFLSVFFYFLLSMFLMKPKFTIYKSSFYIYTICQIYTVNIAKELHASGGAILAHIWAKNAFHQSWLLCLICLPGVLWWLSSSSSRYHGVVWGLWLWYFLIILTYYFWSHITKWPPELKSEIGFKDIPAHVWNDKIDILSHAPSKFCYAKTKN